MYSNVTFSDFIDTFQACDRDTNFSYEGKRILFDYLEQYEEDTDEKIEFDCIALCCDYSEATFSEIADDYSIDIDDLEPEEQVDIVKEYLEYNTTVVGYTDDGAVYAAF